MSKDQKPKTEQERPGIRLCEKGAPSPIRLAKALVNFALRRSQSDEKAA